MNNGDSFHNGQDNLELQKKNRLGTQDGTDDPAETPASGTASEGASASAGAGNASPLYGTAPDAANLPPHKRPYVNIYAKDGGVTYPSGSREALERAGSKAAQTPPEQRGYTNIYAQRVADRSESYQPGQYGNTPDPRIAQTDSQNAAGGATPYYGETSDSTVYQAAAYADEGAEQARKGKFNTASLILGIASFAGNILCLTCLTPITAILAIIFGCLGRIGGRFEQKGLVGLVLGIVYCALMVVMVLFIILIAVIGTAESAGSTV